MATTTSSDGRVCRVCGARGFEVCDLTKHIASIAGFAPAMAREAQLRAMRAADEDADARRVFAEAVELVGVARVGRA